MNDLFYIDFATRTVKVAPYTRDRAMSTSPKFYDTKREALLVLKEYVNEIAQEAVTQLIAIEKELMTDRMFNQPPAAYYTDQ